ncbi:MAG: hypothetical protein ACHQE6_09770, partial [Solirubrobacterales bacterium]
LPPQTPQLPSRRMGAVLAALMLAAGIALGALIGPGPAASLASTSRAAAVGRVLALLALGGGTGSGSNLLLSSGAAHPPASQPKPSSSSETTAGGRSSGAGSGSNGAGGGPGSSSSGSGHSSSAPQTSSTSSPSSGSVSPTSSTTPGAGGGGADKTKTPAALPPIANVWLVVLPPGGSLANAPGQSTATPYLDGQLVRQGTVLSGDSSLAAEQLAGAATLLSGQVGASVSTISPPPSGGPANLQAADAFLQEVVPKIMASAAYREHGLIVIAFGAASPPAASQGAASAGAANQSAASPGAASPPASQGAATEPWAGTTEAPGTEVTYPAGTPTSTLTAAGAPAGALLLSPFLRHVGARSASALNPASPRASLEGLFKTKAPRA